MEKDKEQQLVIKAMSKAEIKEILKPISNREATEIINEMIAESRNIPLAEAKKKQIVYKNEAQKIIYYFGLI